MLYSELDPQRWEVRKVEEFPDGSLGFASAEKSSDKTKLGEEPIPSLAEIAAEPQFKPREITKAEFEAIWEKATRGLP
jgi:hypothetical protein